MRTATYNIVGGATVKVTEDEFGQLTLQTDIRTFLVPVAHDTICFMYRNLIRTVKFQDGTEFKRVDIGSIF